MHRKADHFIGQVRARGGRCVGDPASPSERALAAGVVRPGRGPGEWLWDRAFIEALRDFEGCGSCLAETPDVADTVFHQGLAGIVTLLLFYPLTWWLGSATQQFFGGINVFNYYLSNFPFFFLVIVGSGVVLGAVASYLAVRRYLHI